MKHPIMGFEHLHRHTHYSLLDGLATAEEYAEYSKKVNQQYLCITDHGVMGAVPSQIAAADKFGLSAVFGIEFYINSMQPKVESRTESAAYRKSLPEDQQKRFDKSNHLLGIAYNNEGYKNLVRLSSWGWIHGFYRKPRINHEILNQCKEGIIFTSTCANSEIANVFFEFGDDAGFDVVKKYKEMFGENFYLELMMLDFKLQKPYDAFLIRAHNKFNIPFLLSQDCFVTGTLVLTDEGIKPIESIHAGDKVLTHKNRFREVEVVAHRKLKANEKIYRVKTQVGSYAFEATGQHKIYIAQRKNNIWVFDWKKVENLNKKDYLIIPKINSETIFANQELSVIDLMDFLQKKEYQISDNTQISNGGNMTNKLKFNIETQEFKSSGRFNHTSNVVIPRYLTIDDDLLKIIGWYIAKGWSEKGKLQVGFALHQEEQPIADFIISYFSKFGIVAKTYKVSENGIAVRFSSKVFNRFFSKLCGEGANFKHLPSLNNEWMKVWSKRQLGVILSCYWLGDGSGNNNDSTKQEEYSQFNSTSKILIYQIAACTNALGLPSCPSYGENKHKKWEPSWALYFGKDRSKYLHDFFAGKSINPIPSRFWKDLGDSWGLQVLNKEPIDYEGLIWDLQVEEDHSFTANLHAVSNCHYCRKKQSLNQRLTLMVKNKRTIQEIEALAAAEGEEEVFELQDSNLWMKSEDELNEKWDSDYHDTIDYEIYKQAKANTVKICEKAKGVEIDRTIKLPTFTNENQMLKDLIIKGFQERRLPKKQEYLERLQEEYALICEKGFAPYFIIQKMGIEKAKELCPKLYGFPPEYCRGPGRGSVGASLLAYCLDLHDLDPIKFDLPFSRFLNPARGGKQMKVEFTSEPLPGERTIDLD